jgi:hypothetical protein
MRSAFGVEDSRIAKAKGDTDYRQVAGGLALGAAGSGVAGVSVHRGEKVRAKAASHLDAEKRSLKFADWAHQNGQDRKFLLQNALKHGKQGQRLQRIGRAWHGGTVGGVLMGLGGGALAAHGIGNGKKG